jgi:hypothetical protein
MALIQIHIDRSAMTPMPLLYVRTAEGIEFTGYLSTFRPFVETDGISSFIDFMAYVKAGNEACYCWDGTALLPRSFFHARDSSLKIVCTPARDRGFQIRIPLTEQVIAELGKLEEL